VEIDMPMRGTLGYLAGLTVALGISAAAAQESGALQSAAAVPSLPAMVEPSFFEAAVAAGELPPVSARIPSQPAIETFAGTEKSPGRYGGTLRILGGSAKDTRTLVVYGYARLVGYNPAYEIVPDLAASVEVEEGRRFTFHLRPGHRWSDGSPFTSEDFRYYWHDVANDPEMSRFGPPSELMVAGEKPLVEFPDATTVRYSWSKPNPYFLPALAGAQPLEIFRPAHYLKQFHARYTGLETVEKMAEDEGERNWVALHYSKDRSYRNDNLDLPTLQPWVLKTDPPSDRFIFERNPYFHRVDSRGRQLPYIDRVALTIAGSSLIPAKAAAAEADLQGAYLGFSNYTFLKQAEQRSGYQLRRWLAAKGARVALYPNLNVTDPAWRELFRNANFRRALSIAINREDINNAIFYGLATPSNNTVLPESPLFREEYQTKWTGYDPERANVLLDALGLTERDSSGIRLLPDGRRMQIVVETAGEEVEQTDVLELVRDDWRKLGIGMFIKPSQREVLYNRVKAGSTQMAIWSGLENALIKPAMVPAELAPLNPEQFHWPAWGLWAQTRGQMGEEPDFEPVERLIALKDAWAAAEDDAGRSAAWEEMLSIWADQVFTIGIVQGVDQLVVVSDRLRNVPVRGVYNFDPGAYFGMYRPDTFWFDEGEQVTAEKPA
jgi:peptide/nickel transport system substrate-binding protein